MILFEKIALAAGGLIAAAIGAAILTAPITFHASYGIVLDHDPSLMSEIRAPGAALLVLGAVLCAAVIRAALTHAALWLGALLYGSYGVGRAVSILFDGWPDSELVMTMVFELGIGAVFATTLILRRQRCVAGTLGRARPA